MSRMSASLIELIIVEDDEMAASIYTKFAHKLDNFKVTAIANTGKQAFELLQIYTPNLILLDIFLPDMNGIDLLWEIRKKHRGIDIILITASNDADTVGEAIRGGAFSYIIKPVIIDRFLATLKKYESVHNQLKQSTILEQKQVDSFFHSANTILETRNDKVMTLPKGIDQLTLQRVKEQMYLAKQSLKADELAGFIGVSHSTARRYLEFLVSIDEVKVEVLYGTIGRPERRYKINRRKK